MIDTDKYEGHSEDRVWKQYSTGLTSDYVYNSNDADENLVRDAPLLLAEVKRLQAWKKLVSGIVQQQDGPHLREMLKELIE